MITRISEMKSGGVINTDVIINTKYAYFLIFVRRYGLIIPKLVKNIITTGSSKRNPKGNVMFNKNRKYFSVVKKVVNMSSDNDNKKLITKGNKIKYPKLIPTINRINSAGT